MRPACLCLFAALSITSAAGCARGGDGAPDLGSRTDVPRPDGGTVDVGMIDVGTIDTGATDVGAIDGGPDTGAPDGGGIDAPIVDGGVDAPIDGGRDTGTPDAGVDAPTDTGVDAPVCTPGTMQLLVNPNLDLSPIGTGWSQTPFDPGYPPITDEPLPGLPWQSGSAGIWLGGFDDAYDDASQAVTVPGGAERLVLRGYYAIGTEELGSSIYDTSRVELLSASGAVLETVLSVSSATSAGSWTAFSYTFASPHAGETVRVRFLSETDYSNPTSFVYDTIALEASTCL